MPERSLLWLAARTAALEAARSVKHLRLRPGVLTGRVTRGYCPVCQGPALLVEEGPWLRDQLRCMRCRSIPRWRAIIQVLEQEFPGWRGMDLHECSPGGAASKKLAAECRGYVGSHYFSDVPGGQFRDGYRSENLEQQTFADASFDLVITQDVLEHVFHPARAFSEIARTLRPGGAHVFTVPWYYWRGTVVRAVEEDGQVRHLEPPDYHGNPIDSSGSLVVTDWGKDLLEFIEEHSGLRTVVHRLGDDRLGIAGDFREVFISKKP